LPVNSTFFNQQKYWIEKALEKLDPKCVVFIVDVFGVRFVAEENDAEPGPGSLARLEIRSILFVQVSETTQKCVPGIFID